MERTFSMTATAMSVADIEEKGKGKLMGAYDTN